MVAYWPDRSLGPIIRRVRIPSGIEKRKARLLSHLELPTPAIESDPPPPHTLSGQCFCHYTRNQPR